MSRKQKPSKRTRWRWSKAQKLSMARGRRRYWREYYAKKNKLQPIVGNPKLTAFREEMMRDFIRNSTGLIGELAREDLPAALAIQQMVDEAM